MNFPKLTLIESGLPKTEYEINQAEMVIGRIAPAELVIPGQGVSGRHARIITRGGELVIEDLGSTNGTFVNGKRIAGPVQLRSGDEVTLGRNVVLRVSTPVQQVGDGGTILEADGGTMLEAPPTPQPAAAAPVQAPAAPPQTPAAPPPPGDPGATVMGDMDAASGPSQLVVSIARLTHSTASSSPSGASPGTTLLSIPRSSPGSTPGSNAVPTAGTTSSSSPPAIPRFSMDRRSPVRRPCGMERRSGSAAQTRV